MPLTFPHFGSLKYVFEIVLRELGRNDLILPNKPSKKTLQLGSRYSPEFVCTPFKMVLGTFIENLERGADELASGGGKIGYCRFRYYIVVQQMILEDLGYKFKVVKVDYEKPLEIIKTFKQVGQCSVLQTIRAFRYAWVKNRLIDKIDECLWKYRAIESERGTTEELANKLYQDVVDVKGFRKTMRFYRKIPKIFDKEINIYNDLDPLKVVINGEIYVVLEPALNLEIFKKLNEMGVIVKSAITLRRFIDIGQKLNPFITMEYQHAIKHSKEYISVRVGGETQENLGDIKYYKKKGYDGIVHLYPFTCMPEIITRSIAPEASRDYEMPFLSLVLDEHTGEAGLQTRLEAFIDLLERQRERKRGIIGG